MGHYPQLSGQKCLYRGNILLLFLGLLVYNNALIIECTKQIKISLKDHLNNNIMRKSLSKIKSHEKYEIINTDMLASDPKQVAYN